jgi:hypothetical protein
MQQYVIFNVLKEYCISKEEENTGKQDSIGDKKEKKHMYA